MLFEIDLFTGGMLMGWAFGYLCGWFMTLLDWYLTEKIKGMKRRNNDGNK